MYRRTPTRGNRGQAIAEYILLIGLIILFMIVVLYEFRDSVNIYTNRVIAWIEGQDTPPQPVATPTPAPRIVAPPPPATPTPRPSTTPTPAPTPADDSATFLTGRWCGPQFTWVVSRSAPGQIYAYRIYPDGRQSAGDYFNLTVLRPGIIRETGVRNPNDIGDAARISDNTIQSPPNNGGYLTRC
ncbi:MAG: hypothetical protein ABI718_13420 [Acidobacteriota bacterium]